MRKIDLIIIHCSASRPGHDLGAKEIDQMHREQNGWKGIGYHYVVRLDGTVEKGRDDSVIGAHAAGYNGSSVAICYIGGLDENGKATDTRTKAQKQSIHALVNELCRKYPVERIIGHRDISPDLNGNGRVDPWERIKECPCYDVIPEYRSFLPETAIQP